MNASISRTNNKALFISESRLDALILLIRAILLSFNNHDQFDRTFASLLIVAYQLMIISRKLIRSQLKERATMAKMYGELLLGELQNFWIPERGCLYCLNQPDTKAVWSVWLLNKNRLVGNTYQSINLDCVCRQLLQDQRLKKTNAHRKLADLDSRDPRNRRTLFLTSSLAANKP